MKIPWRQLEEVLKNDDNYGFCLACGEEAYNVEPDARKSKCEACGEPRVFGAQEILLMEEYE